MIKNKFRYKFIDDVFQDMHWLKIPDRINYKILTATYKCIHGDAPQSLCALMQSSNSERLPNLQETRINSRYGERALSHIGPKLWNTLPADIRNASSHDKFKTLLKSYLLLHGDDFRRLVKVC